MPQATSGRPGGQPCLIEPRSLPRRIYTDGRDWPKDLDPTFTGYSIGKWIDEDGDDRFDVPTNLASNAYFCACGK
jgi:hypothetical protein